MAEVNARDAKLIQYLNEAYGKEKELETSLEAHIAMAAPRKPYQKKLQEHLRETKRHAKEVERRIKKLGGKAETVSVPGGDQVTGIAQAAQTIANKAAAAAQGPLHMLRGDGEQEKLLKNAKTEYSDEAEEIANYTAIETLATAVGDKETANLAKSIRREEERMAKFLSGLIPKLTKAVATEDIPAALRSSGRRRSSGTRKRASSSSRSSGGSSSARSKASGRSASSRRSGSGSTGTQGKSAAGRGTAKGRSSSARKLASKSGSSSKRSTASSRSGGSSRSSGASRSSGQGTRGAQGKSAAARGTAKGRSSSARKLASGSRKKS